jgi:hypothetical protein
VFSLNGTILTSKHDVLMLKLLAVLFGCCTDDRYSFPRVSDRVNDVQRQQG